MKNYRTTYHKDGTVTVWDVYQQQWCRRVAHLPDHVLASLDPAEREKVIRHLASGSL